MSLSILFHFLCAQHVSDINISIIRSLRLCCRITTSVVLFSVRCVGVLVRLGLGGVRVVGWSLQHGHHLKPAAPKAEAQNSCASNLQHEHHSKPAAPNLQHTTNWEQDDRCGNSTTQSKLLMMDILMSETCGAHKKWNKIASDIKLVFHSSTITMMHGPVNIRDHFTFTFYQLLFKFIHFLEFVHHLYWNVIRYFDKLHHPCINRVRNI